MSAAIPLRDDFDGPKLRALAKGSRDPVHVRAGFWPWRRSTTAARAALGRGLAGSAFRAFETGCFVSTPAGLKCQRRSKFPHFGRSNFPHLLGYR